MIALGTFFVALIFSLTITRVAAVALEKTGITQDIAKFQARSALTGSGFTTEESDHVVSHPVRRKIISFLLLIGNAGLVTAVATLVLTFMDRSESANLELRAALLLIGLAALWFLTRSRWVSKITDLLVDKALSKWTRLDVKDYIDLLHLKENFAVSRLKICERDWLIGRSLGQSRLHDEGVVVLGVERSDGRYVGVPTKQTKIKEDDTLLIYGPADVIEELDSRPEGSEGDARHSSAVNKEEIRRQKQHHQDEDDNFKLKPAN
jgi:hypothetical protein